MLATGGHLNQRRRSIFLLRWVAVLLACGVAALGAHAQAPVDTTSSPGATWETVAPESVSFSSVYFEALTTFLKAHHTTAMVVAVHGKIIYQYGDISRVSVIASVRKSVLSMLYGNYVNSGKIDTQKTVKQLGLDDKQPFLPIEENSKLEYLLAGRSGIYIVPEKPDSLSADSYQPRRGTQLPGNYFTYNEWDFNAAGTAFEKLTGKNIYDALESDLARPVAMQDFDRARQKKNSNLPFSLHPQYPMYLSTRDMARLGHLMLRHGNWNGKQVIPDDWVRYSTILWTPFQDMNPSGLREYARPDRWGFGLMWFVWDEPGYLDHNWTGPMQGAIIAMGSGGQYIAVLPESDMVIAHKVDFDTAGGQINPIEWDAILNLVLASSCFGNCPTPPQ
jgi:CubicO group peptidase (beta-lactamase class C family)